MRKISITLLLVLGLLLTACGSNSEKEDNQKLKVVTSFTILKDMAEQIGGDLIEIYNLVPSGTAPHEYEPKPEDIKAASDADVLFYNGINLEGGKGGWFFKMVDSVNQDENVVFNLTLGVSPKYLGDGSDDAQINPHGYIDPQIGIIMANNLTKALITADPENEDAYLSKSQTYIDRLNEIDANYQAIIDAIPEENKILVTSELAFQYMTDRYGLREASVWEIDTEELGTSKQLKALIEKLKEDKPPYLFLESNVDPKPLEQVSKETGIPIYKERIYSDEIGNKGEVVDTYIKFLEHNIKIINDGLGE